MMKTTFLFEAVAVIALGILAGSCARPPAAAPASATSSEVAAQLKTFAAAKKAQAETAARSAGKDLSVFKPFFAAADQADWLAISNAFEELRNWSPQFGGRGVSQELLRGTAWEAVKEIWGAYDAFGEGDERYSLEFATNIIASVPAGSVYFGGTDPGRFLITALQKSHERADPFFTLTQNALVDGSYVDYLRRMYGGRLVLPTAEDSQKCFQDYLQDAMERYHKNQLKPGEDVRPGTNGQIQVSGQVAVMAINGLLAKLIFDKNPDREFYVEESFPLDWMYPRLAPHGLIMKINRQPLPGLANEIVQRDRDYWQRLVQPMIGGWLTEDTSVGEIAAFARKVFGRQDFSGFTGDPRFVQNAYSHRMFSKLRSSLGGLYAWRAKKAAGADEKERMAREADFAFRQAWALCPTSPEAVYRYANLLVEQNRGGDALLVAETAVQLPGMQGPESVPLRALVEQLRQHQGAR